MERLFNKSMVFLLVFALLFSNNTVFGGVTSTELKDQGSKFNPEEDEFKTVMTLDANLAGDDAVNNNFNSYASALSKAKSLSPEEKPVLIKVKAGNYSSGANVANIDNLVIRGEADDPEDVVITASNGSYVVELGKSLAAGGFYNFIMENLTVKLTMEAHTTGIQVGGTGLNHDITLRNLIIDAERNNLSEKSINGVYLFNGRNITVDNVKVKTAMPDNSRAVVLASTSDSVVKGINSNCTIPVSALDYYDAKPVIEFPSNNYVEGTKFIIAVSRSGRYSYIMAPSYEKVLEYASLEINPPTTKLRAIIDVADNQLVVDDRMTSFGAMESYLIGTDSANEKAFPRERENSDNWYNTKSIALVNPSGNYAVNVEGLTITAYNENYSADSYIPISGISFSGNAVSVKNFDFSGLPDPTLEGLINSGVLPPGSVVKVGDGSDVDNIIWAKMTFDPNGGTVSTTTAIMKCGNYSGKDPQLPQPVRDGYRFSGWFTELDEKGTDQILLGIEGATVYAKWTKESPVPIESKKDTKTMPDINPDNKPDSRVVIDPYSNPHTKDSMEVTKFVIILCFSILCLVAILRMRRESARRQ